VVTNTSGLTGVEMQDIASDLGFSETIFLDRGDPPPVRIFTPGREMPFAGHPLVGVTWLMRELGIPHSGRLSCGIGDVTVGYDAAAAWIEVSTQRSVRPLTDPAAVAERLGVPEPIDSAWVDMPIPYLLIELPSHEDVANAQFDQETMESLGIGELNLYSWVGDRAVKARFFAPEAGVFEDPATGSAAVALASMLASRGQASGKFEISQGDEIGHPSTILLDWNRTTIRIGGTVRRVDERILST
jgi:trans-2,3-dihydro-3-hydroxyanthranilate isomerase